MKKIDAIKAALTGERPQLILQCPGKPGDTNHRCTHTLYAADGTRATAGVRALCAGCGHDRLLVSVEEIAKLTQPVIRKGMWAGCPAYVPPPEAQP